MRGKYTAVSDMGLGENKKMRKEAKKKRRENSRKQMIMKGGKDIRDQRRKGPEGCMELAHGPQRPGLRLETPC